MRPPRALAHPPGFTVLEVLVAVTLVAAAMLPVLYLASSNVEGARVDRVRIVCDTLCLSALERFGRFENGPWESLAPTDDPRERAGLDLWKRDPELGAAVSDPGIRAIIEAHDVHSKVTMVRDLEPGLHRLVSEVSWIVRTGTEARRDRVSYTRFLVKPLR